MLSVDEVQKYRIPGLAALNKKQIGFLVDILNGKSKVDSYIDNYNPKYRDYDYVMSQARQTMNTRWYKGYSEYFERLILEREQLETGWNLDLAIQERKKLYSLNLLEVNRLAHAYDKEIEYYTSKKEQAIEEDDEKKIEYYENRIIKAIKSKNMSVASNTACQQALDGLDKLCGLQTVNVNHQGDINFFGEDMWEDNNSGENG